MKAQRIESLDASISHKWQDQTVDALWEVTDFEATNEARYDR